MPEVGELQGRTDMVGELCAKFVAVTANHENEAADGICGAAGVGDSLVPRIIVGLDLVLLKGVDEVAKRLTWEIAGGDGFSKSDKDGVAAFSWRVEALIKHAVPGVKQAERGAGVGNFIAEVVGDATEGIEAIEVGTDTAGEKPGRHVEVFIVGRGEVVAPRLGFDEGGPLFRREELGGRPGKSVPGGRLALHKGGAKVDIRRRTHRSTPAGNTAVLMSRWPKVSSSDTAA